MSLTPTATILVLNYNGQKHLEGCLPSLAQLDYPGASVMVVDNGSTDGSLEYLRRAHPSVQVLALGSNRGFAPAYNIAVRQCTSDVVVLLNNDTRVEPTWLSSLVDVLERHGAAAAASCMLDWDGHRIDFVGGLPTFLGHAWQVDHGLPVGRSYAEQPLLFGCGGSLAIRRDAYQQVGGFDDDYFVYFEDLDLGWRMTLAGLPTVLAPRAITYHRLHGTASGWGATLRLRIYERNALFTLYKNYGDEALARVLPAAITLTLARALAGAELDGDAVRFGQAAPDRMHLPSPVIATMLALEDFARALPALKDKRRHVQASRRISDEELFRLFPEPLKLHDAGGTYQEAARALVHDLRIDELFGLRTTPSVAVAGAAHEPAHAQRAGEDRPLVSIVVLTASGARHLPECLDSLRQHAWPADRTEVIVVDNGSPDDPTAVATARYPGVRVVRTGNNLGFSGGNNAGARVATGDWLVFLNDDTRVEAGWLNAMMDVAQRRNAASVGAFIVDWAGERVDFAGGLVNFEGRGFAQGYDLPVADVTLQEQPLLFGCGAAVLFRRDVFEASGGWDEPTFAYYEDVEFGWRLWMLGHEVWFAPRAIVHHRHHGTSGSESPARLRALERNALRMIYSLLEESTLQQVLPAALLLATDRALLTTPFSRANDGVVEARPWRGLTRRLHPRGIKARLLHALSVRGARRQYSALTNIRRVGARGLAGSVLDVARSLRDGWDSGGARANYLIEYLASVHRTRRPAGMAAHLDRRRAPRHARLRRDAARTERASRAAAKAASTLRSGDHRALRRQLDQRCPLRTPGPAHGPARRHARCAAREALKLATSGRRGRWQKTQDSRLETPHQPFSQRAAIKQGVDLAWRTHAGGLHGGASVPGLSHAQECIPLRARETQASSTCPEPDEQQRPREQVQRQVAPQQRRRHVLHEQPLQVAVPVIHREVAADAGAGRPEVVHDGIGHIPARTAGELQAEAEVDVLRVAEEALVEATRPYPVGASIERRGRTGREDRSAAMSLWHLLLRSAVGVPPDQAAHVAHVAHAVQPPGLPSNISREANEPASGCASAAASNAASQPGSGNASGLRRAMASQWASIATPRLLAAANPRFAPAGTTRTRRGPPVVACSTVRQVPSVLALSTMTTSSGRRDCAATDCSARPMNASAL